MARRLTLLDVFAGLFVLASAAATMTFSLLSLFGGHDWQSLAFAAGGAYLALWSGFRLTR
jgi:hypothetical protein